MKNDNTLKIAVYLFISYFLFLLLVSNLHISADGTHMYAVTRSIVYEHKLSVPEGFGAITYNGRTYTRYGLGTSIAVIPFEIISRIVGKFAISSLSTRALFSEAVASLFNIIITSLTAVFVFLYAKKMYFPNKLSFFLSAIYIYATFAMAHSRGLESEPLTTFCILSSCYYFEFYRNQPKYLFLSGFLIAYAIFTRITAITVLPIFYLFLLFDWKIERNTFLKKIICFTIPIIFIFALSLLYNYVRQGNPLKFGYSDRGFTEHFLTGVYGLILSPGKGLFIYNPILLFSLYGFWYLFKNNKIRFLFWGYIFLITICFYAKWFSWEGGWTWGPRFLLVVTPFLVLLIGYYFQSKHFNKSLFVIVLIISIGIQLLSVSVNFARYLHSVNAKDESAYRETFFEPLKSPIIGQVKSLNAVIQKMKSGEVVSLNLKQGRQYFSEGSQKITNSSEILEKSISLNIIDILPFWLYYAGIKLKFIIPLTICLMSIHIFLMGMIYKKIL